MYLANLVFFVALKALACFLVKNVLFLLISQQKKSTIKIDYKILIFRLKVKDLSWKTYTFSYLLFEIRYFKTVCNFLAKFYEKQNFLTKLHFLNKLENVQVNFAKETSNFAKKK